MEKKIVMVVDKLGRPIAVPEGYLVTDDLKALGTKLVADKLAAVRLEYLMLHPEVSNEPL